MVLCYIFTFTPILGHHKDLVKRNWLFNFASNLGKTDFTKMIIFSSKFDNPNIWGQHYSVFQPYVAARLPAREEGFHAQLLRKDPCGGKHRGIWEKRFWGSHSWHFWGFKMALTFFPNDKKNDKIPKCSPGCIPTMWRRVLCDFVKKSKFRTHLSHLSPRVTWWFEYTFSFLRTKSNRIIN